MKKDTSIKLSINNEIVRDFLFFSFDKKENYKFSDNNYDLLITDSFDLISNKDKDHRKVFLGSLEDSKIKSFNYPIRIGAIYDYIDNLENDLGISLGKYKLFKNQKTLKLGNKEIILTDKELDIILFLSNQLSEYVSKEILLKEVWGYNCDITTHTVETHIYRLRQKIEDKNFLISENDGYKISI